LLARHLRHWRTGTRCRRRRERPLA
jgi:hypothetical protein